MKKYLNVLFCCFLISNVNAQYFEMKQDVGDVVDIPLKQAGCTWFDYNNDGFVDLIIMGYDRAGEYYGRLYTNNGDKTFTVVDNSELYIDGTGGVTAIAGDYDNDGDIDLYQLNFQQSNGNPYPNYIYRNSGAPNYSFNQTLLAGNQGEASHSSSATWVDYDLDGDLDIFEAGANRTPDLFFRNDGRAFTGIDTLAFMESRTSAIAKDTWFDYDNDGDFDLYITNWANQNNKLYLSQLKETGDPNYFTELQVDGITNNAGNNIGCNWIDYDNDRDLDLYLNYFRAKDRIYENNGDGTFTQITDQPMLQSSGFTTVNTWNDFDNDGDLDLYQCTGSNGGSMPGFLYENDGSGQFIEVERTTSGDISNTVTSPQSGGWGDYDNDGDMDLIVITCCVGSDILNGTAQSNVFYENMIGQENNFAKIYLEGVQSNKQGMGSTIYLKANIDGADRWQMRRIRGGLHSFPTQEEQLAHFGLGNADQIDSLIIHWTSGIRDTCVNVSTGTIKMREGSCEPIVVSVSNTESEYDITIYPNPTNNYLMIENNMNEPIYAIKLFDIAGHLIKKEQFLVDANNPIAFSLPQVTAGIYPIQLIMKDKIVSTKVTIR